ncbi:vef [Erannis ankeraria nucleopolyhedrovirus]|uniref:vef n=1 Tax=Erannis ankeraria nucleopolyhedrovirus TaxID=2913600 RepID=UPI002481C450|nr:vef [Erannis ankeraria nucleopolyhedrovirus]UJZ89038.1 vef [Erannis ankeraria nucleopolyhedrovirus]
MDVNFTLIVRPIRLPIWINPNEIYMGINHNRVPLGYICDANSTLTIDVRQSSARLRCLNNGARREAAFTITGLNNEIVHNQVYVPFIDRNHDSTDILLNVNISNYTHILPHYIHNVTNEEAFKTQWQNNDAPFAFIELDLVVLLVPEIDKNTVMNLNLNNLNQFYSDIVNLYDDLSGLTNDDELDMNFEKKYFCKADENGAGAAYYGNFWTANSSASIGRYLEIRNTNWLVFHEIGHAYDFEFIVNTPQLNEVWNNILGDRYQYLHMTASERQTLASVYENGNRARVEANISQLISSKTYYADWSFFQKLIVFTWMMNTSSGPDTMKSIYRNFRRIKVLDEIYPPIFDWWAMVANDDFIPYLNSMQIPIISYYKPPINKMNDSFAFSQQNAFYKRVPYPVNQLVNNYDVIANNYNLNLESNFSLIYPGDINISVSLTIICLIDSIEQIRNEPFLFYDGRRLAYSAHINSRGQLTLPNIDVGVYTLHPPRGRNKRYKIYLTNDRFLDEDNKNLYIFVNNTNQNLMLNYVPYNSSEMYDKIIGHVLGLNDMYRLKFTIHLKAQIMQFMAYSSNFNSGYGSSSYFRAHFSGETRNETINYTGTNNVVGMTTMSFDNTDSINVTHQQGNRRMFFKNISATIIGFRVIDGEFLSNLNGIMPINELIIDRIVECVNWLNDHPTMLSIENSIRDEILINIVNLPNADMLLTEYKEYLPNYYRENTIVNPIQSSIAIIVSIIAAFVFILLIIFVILTKKPKVSNTTFINSSKPRLVPAKSKIRVK